MAHDIAGVRISQRLVRSPVAVLTATMAAENGPGRVTAGPGTMTVWATVVAVRERRLLIETGQPLHTLVQAVPFTTIRDLLHRIPDKGQIGWEVAADSSRPQGLLRRLSGQVETLSVVTSRFVLDYQRWVPDPLTVTATRVPGTRAPHLARHNTPADGGPVLIGYLITLSNAHTAAHIR